MVAPTLIFEPCSMGLQPAVYMRPSRLYYVNHCHIYKYVYTIKQVWKFPEFIHEFVHISNTLYHCCSATQWSQSWCAIQWYVRIGLLVAQKESVRNIHKHLCMFMEVLQKHCWLLCEKRDGFWNRKRRSPRSALLRLSCHSF